MNIKEFLLNNYIWILVVILLSIITVIGFLADKSKGTKKNKQKQSPMTPMPNQNVSPINSTPINYQPTQTVPEPINYQNPQMINNPSINNIQPMPNPNLNSNININQPMNPNLNNPNQPINYNPNPMDNLANQSPMINNMPNPNTIGQNNILNNPMPVENIMENNAPNPEPMYQPLSEQKPTFGPSNIETNNVFGGNIPNQELNNPINVIPTIEQAPINPYQVPQNNGLVNNQPIINQTPNIIPNQINEPVQMTPNYNNSPVQNIIPEPTNYQPIPTATEPITYQQNNQAPIPNQPVPAPEPIPNINQNTIPNPITPPQPAVNPQPITFVYGPQSNNNNQNM